MKLEDLSFKELTSLTDLSTFNCDDSDLNEFLKRDSLKYQKQLIAKTYLFIKQDLLSSSQSIVSFFSVSNDNLIDKGYTNTAWNKLHRKTKIPNSKRIRQYPAVKIGRLGVSNLYQKQGIGGRILDFVKGWILQYSITACRFILVDAYNKPDVIKFYEKNGFTLLLDEDKDDTTRIMYFDLIRFQ